MKLARQSLAQKRARPAAPAAAAERPMLASTDARGGEVIFALTVSQAAALLAIELGGRIRAESMAARLKLIGGLERKGLIAIEPGTGTIRLTQLGAIGAALCANLTLLKLNGRGSGLT